MEVDFQQNHGAGEERMVTKLQTVKSEYIGGIDNGAALKPSTMQLQ